MSCRDGPAIWEVSMLLVIELNGAELVYESLAYRLLFSGKYIAVVWAYWSDGGGELPFPFSRTGQNRRTFQVWSPPWKQCQAKLKSPVFLPSHREAHRHEKAPLYRRTDFVCAKTGRNWHPCRGSLPKDGHFWSHFLHQWTPSVLQVLNLVLGCCLHLSGIRKICAQMGNSHTITSTTGRPLRPV